jgi:PAS domain S-box-containing protein
MMCQAGQTAMKRLCVLLLFLLLLASGVYTGPAHAKVQSQNPLDEKNLLVLHAFDSSLPIFELTDRGLKGAMDAGGMNIRNQFFEYLDLARNPGPEHRKLLAEQMRLRYSHRKLDTLVTLYPEALEFAFKDCRDVFPDAPIIALYLPNASDLPKTDRPIIGLFPTRDIMGTLEIALKLVPAAKRVYVVSGAHKVDREGEDQARGVSKKWEGQLEFLYLSHMPFEDILTTVSNAPPGSFILVLGFLHDVTGKKQTTREVARQVSQISSVPVFGIFDVTLGVGIAGGSLLSFEHIGTKAGQLALDILGGTKAPRSIPAVLDVPSVSMFDWRQLRRWNLSENALPPGSIVINREVTLWDLRYYFIGGLAFMLAESILIAGLLIQKRRRKAAEESLRQKTEELDQFFSINLDLLAIANTDGYFLRLNPAWEKTLGYGQEELRSRRFLDFVHPDDLESTQEAVSLQSSQQSVIHFENRYRCKDGTYRWLEWMSAPAGHLIFAAARDITERLKAEAEFRQQWEQLAHVTRIAMMGELTASLAHEINQPLTAIQSNAEAAQRFLSAAVPDTGEVRQILEDIVRDNRRASEVIRKIRALLKREPIRFAPLDLNDLIQDVLSLVRGDSLLQQLSITSDFSPALPPVSGDRVQLQQVVLNLVLNGAAAMKNAPVAQRKLTVTTEAQEDRTVKVSVTDLGTGIEEHNIERLFDPFYTTKPEGMGMGLSITRTIVSAHGGTISAANNPQGGATFFFSLPAYQGGPS